MSEIQEKLEALFDKVRTLPTSEQEAIADTLEELTSGELYRLNEEELAVLIPELEGARRGEFASAAEVDAVLHKPWTKSKGS